MLLLDSNVDWPVDSVVSDNFAAEFSIVNYLASLGHREMAILAYAIEDYNIDQRVRGFVAGLRACGWNSKESRAVLRKNVSHEDIYSALKARLSGPNPPTAVAAINDTLAAAMLERLTRDGIHVPGSLSLFGYDDNPISRETLPSLSTIKVDKKKLGEAGAELILRRVENPTAPVEKRVLPAEMVHRGSVCPAGR